MMFTRHKITYAIPHVCIFMHDPCVPHFLSPQVHPIVR